MTLEELLDHISGNVLDDRSDLVSGAPDELFSEATLVRYLNEGQRQFCRKAWPIIDDETASCCEIDLVAEQATYPLHSSVVRVYSVRPNDSDIPLSPLNWALISSQVAPEYPDFLENRFAYSVPSGRPAYYSLDEATRKLRIRPKPSADQVTAIVKLKLRVARMPITLLSVDDPEGVPEIPEDYHMNLCDFAAGSALSQQNIDADAKKDGRDLLAKFYADLRAAKIDQVVAQRNPARFVFGGWAEHTGGLK